MAEGTKADPWVLKTPPGTSEYTMYRDEQADPPALVCQVGATTLKYRLQAIDDLHAWLVAQGDWVALGAADEKSRQRQGPSKPGVAHPTIRWAAGTDYEMATAAASGCTCPRCWRPWVWPR